MGVGRVPFAHLFDGATEKRVAQKDVGPLREEAEDQPRHEMVHVVAAGGRAPIGVFLQELDIEPVQPARRPDVEGVLADLLDGRNAGEGQEEAEMVREVGVAAGDGPAAADVLGFEPLAVRRQNEFRLRLGRRRAGLQRRQRFRDLAGGGDGDMDVVGLKDAAEVRPVRFALAEAFERRLFVAERFEEGERELLRIKRPLGQPGYRLFDLDSVHFLESPTGPTVPATQHR